MSGAMDLEQDFGNLLTPDEPPAPASTGEGEGGAARPAAVTQEQYQEVLSRLEKFETQEGDVRASQELLGKLKEVFVPNDGEAANKAAEQLALQFDRDPIGVISQLVDQKVDVIRQRQEASDVDRFAKEVMAEIDRDFKVDWAKDSKKIVDEMRMFSDDFKRNDPKGAALKAIQLAGVSCEKRPNPLDLPFLESSGSYNQMRTKALETEKEKYLSGFREAAKEANTAPLSGLWD